MHATSVMWLPQHLFQACVADTNRYHPLESGGVFMGYWADATTSVITELIGAGPGADRGFHHFAPDQEWQIAEIARVYESSGRKHTYLGDWHSHPGAADGDLSRTDRRVLRRIIDTPQARAPQPIMAVIHGVTEQQMTVWVARTLQRRFLWRTLVVENVTLQVF